MEVQTKVINYSKDKHGIITKPRARVQLAF
jgi:hypothetical protein